MGPRGAAVSAERADAERADTERFDDDYERSTAQGKDEPPTLNGIDGSPATIPREPPNARRGRSNAISLSFEDETQARPVDHSLLDRLRGAASNGPGVAGAADLGAAPAVAAAPPANLGIDYESLPSLEVRRPYDTYEAEFSERDPVTQLHAAPLRDVSYDERAYREEPSFQEPSYPLPIDSFEAPETNDQAWARREESGPRERPLPDARSYAAPAPSYDDVSDSARWSRDNGAQAPSGWSNAVDEVTSAPMIPPAPRVPEALNDVHPPFVQGVQPIRTATPDAWGTPHVRHTPVPMPAPMHAVHSSMPPAYAQQAHYGQQLQHAHGQQQQPQQAHYTPAPQAPYGHPQSAPPPQAAYGQHAGTSYAPQGYPGQQHYSAPPMHPGASSQMPAVSQSMANRAQPLSAQLAGGSDATAKIGRFAWFVAGAAFGITFAFFATGFFNGKTQSDFPAAPPLPPVATATAFTAPAAPPAGLAAPVVAAAGVAAPGVAAPGVGVAAPGVGVAAAPAAVAPAGLVAPAGVVPAAGAAPMVMAAPPVAPPVAAPGVAAPAQVAAAAPAAAARPAAAPARPRSQPAPRRPAPPPPPVSQAPKNLGGGGPGADDEPRSPPPSAPSGGGDIGDLLGAGLKP